MPKAIAALLAITAAWTLAVPELHAQETRSLDLTANDVGISIGDSRRTIGLRLNFRDRRLEEAIGVNATIWTPYAYTGHVKGIALGLPATGARRIDGVALALFGVSTSETMSGIAAGGLGVGSGNEVRGLAVGGLGVGAGQNIVGIAIGGVGAGAGGDVRGLAIGGLGVGAGGNATGILLGGLGSGVGGNATGLLVGGLGSGIGGNATGMVVAGLGAGVGGDLRGVSVAGLGLGVGGDAEGVTIALGGLGVGGDVTGLQIAGLGIGVGGTLRWVSVAGLGIGAPTIEGLTVAAAVAGHDVRGLTIAPAYFRIPEQGSVRGVNASAFNHVKGTQHGLAIGLFNYARVLDGVQLGVLNYAANKSPGTRLLPVINVGRAR
jgi:hypothetical protein